MNFPDFIIIGACKCGTTSLYKYLTEHPDILESYGNGIDGYLGTKEIRYFDRYYAKGLDWYKSRFPATRYGQITGEASPEYMWREMCLQRMHDQLPQNIKIIISLRNPVDRLFSHYQHVTQLVDTWGGVYSSFEDYLMSAKEQHYYLISQGIYVNQLRKVYDLWNPTSVFVVKAEDLYNDAKQVCAQLYKFLKVRPYALKDITPQRTLQYTPMHISIRRLLEAFYEPYNQELYDFLGYDMLW